MSSAGRPPPRNVPGYPERNREPDLAAELAAKELERERARQGRPAVPPPPEPHVETSAPVLPPAPAAPSPEKPPSMFERAKSSSWTPAGVVLIIGALGGPMGLSTLIGVSERTKLEILEKIEEKSRIDREDRAAIRKDLTTTQNQVAYVAGLQCKQNGGKPHETFPCDGFPEATKANKDTKSPPWFVTDKPYPGSQ